MQGDSVMGLDNIWKKSKDENAMKFIEKLLGKEEIEKYHHHQRS